jgi:thiamine biosynthesis protein ThiI
MTTTTQGLTLVRLSAELSTKGRATRKRFTKKLVENIRAALRDTSTRAHVDDQWNRLFVHTAAAPALDALARIPGISSFSVVEAQCPAELDEIVRVGKEIFAEWVKGRTFAVRARRTGRHAFSSQDVQVALGAALNAGAKVDLTNPDVEVEVEVREQVAYLFGGRTPGLGGLPLGVEGRAVCLLSGGFDSAIAAWLMLKRGVALDYVFCNLAGDAYERSVVMVAKILADQWSHGTRPRLHVIDFNPPVDALRASAQPRYWQLVLKRLMYRAAGDVAAETGAVAIITGESIGQVSSQTLTNLAALEGTVEIPVLRPLLGFDKMDIVDLARRIGTFEISATVKEYCAITPGSPITNATRAATDEEEAKVDLSVLERATRERRVLDLHEVTGADLAESYLFTDEVPAGAVVMDVRTETEWDAWHYPGAQHREYWQLAEEVGRLDPDRTYVLYCDAGMQAAFLAEKMQKRGLEAYALRGGTRALKRSDGAASVEDAGNATSGG